MIFDKGLFEEAHIALRIFMAAEREFNIEITDEEAVGIETLDQLVKLIKSKGYE